MSYRHIYTPVAFNEYKDAVDWYATRNNRAAAGFVIAVKERLGLICEKPQQYRNTYKNFRETLLKKYPFYIIYFIDEGNKTVIIVSIFHHKRNPAKKYPK